MTREEYLRLHERLGAASSSDAIHALHLRIDAADHGWIPSPPSTSAESPGTLLARWTGLLDSLRAWRASHPSSLARAEVELLAKLDTVFESMPVELQGEALQLLWRGDPEEFARRQLVARPSLL